MIKESYTNNSLSIIFNRRDYDTNEHKIETVNFLTLDVSTNPSFPSEWVRKFRLSADTQFNSGEPVPSLYGLESNGVLRLWTTEQDPVPMHSEVERALGQPQFTGVRLQLTSDAFGVRKVRGEEKPPKLSQTIELEIPSTLDEIEKQKVEERYKRFLEPITSPPKEGEFFYEIDPFFTVEVKDLLT